MNRGELKLEIENGVGIIQFYHPSKNCLPTRLLGQITSAIGEFDREERVQVIVLRSRGDSAFCTGMFCEELATVDSAEKGKEFFMGFARLILAVKNCPKFVVVRVHGKVMGGGVGLVSVADYALALDCASVKLSELSLGIGSFVLGPCLERRLGLSAFSALAMNQGWRDALWARRHGFYSDVFATVTELDRALSHLTRRLADSSPSATARMKKIFWDGTDHWDRLLEERAALSGQLLATEFTSRTLTSRDRKKL